MQDELETEASKENDLLLNFEWFTKKILRQMKKGDVHVFKEKLFSRISCFFFTNYILQHAD